MNNITIGKALQILCPGAQWVLNGEILAGLTWLDTNQARPTDDEIISQIAIQE